MEKKGIKFYPEAQIEKIEKISEKCYKTTLNTEKTIENSHILFATGRKPNIDGLNLEKIGVKTNNKGAIEVNQDEQTNISSIYAVGDVTDRITLTPVALAEGHALVDRLYGDQDRYISYENVPSAMFTTPNVSNVGLTEDQAHKKYGNDIDIYTANFRGMKKIMANNEERTFMKLIVQRSTDKVIGLHMAGEDAGEIVQGFATAIIAGATKSDFDHTIGIHPTAAEEFVTMREKTR